MRTRLDPEANAEAREHERREYDKEFAKLTEIRWKSGAFDTEEEARARAEAELGFRFATSEVYDKQFDPFFSEKNSYARRGLRDNSSSLVDDLVSLFGRFAGDWKSAYPVIAPALHSILATEPLGSAFSELSVYYHLTWACYETHLKADPYAAMKGKISARNGDTNDYDLERLHYNAPEHYPDPNEIDLLNSLDPDHFKKRALDGLFSRMFAREDPHWKQICEVNQMRWGFVFCANEALTPGINDVIQSTLGVDLVTVPNYRTDMFQPAPIWQAPDAPDHPWQRFQPYPNPWMSQFTPSSHAWQMKSPAEYRMDGGLGWKRPNFHYAAHDEVEWDDLAEMQANSSEWTED